MGLAPHAATRGGCGVLVTQPCPGFAHRPVRRLPSLRLVAAFTDPTAWRASFNRQASNAKAKFEEWARQQRLNERLNSGMEAASRAAQLAAEQASQTARKVDKNYDVTGKAAEAAQKAAKAAQKAAEAARGVNEAAEDLDSRFQFRRHTRNFYTDFKRRLPYIWRQVQEFSGTPMGAITFFFVFLVSVFTGAFWVILRLLASLVWIGILLSPMLINYVNARMMREQQERYKEYVQEQERRQKNPFRGTIFEDVFARGGKSRSKKVSLDSQDVIDISYEKIHDSD